MKPQPLRIAFGRLMQESNSFSSVLTTRADFERSHLLSGETLMSACQPKNWEVEGFLKNLELSGFVKGVQALAPETELIPLLSAWSISGGPVSRAFFDKITADFCERLRQAGPVDGVFLALHGAMGVEGGGDPETELITAIREVVGQVPIAVSFDLHANLTRSKVELIDLICAYQTNPHYDMAKTGFRAGQLLLKTLQNKIQPTRAWRSLPLLLAGGNTVTLLSPMRQVFKRMRQMQADPRVLNVNLLMCHPYLDHPELGWAVEVSTDNAPELAEQLADELAETCWQLRHQQPPEFLSAPEMLKQVRQAKFARKWGSVAVCDASDVVGAGGTGENTHLLKFLLDEATDLVSLYPLRDPAAVAELWELSEGDVCEIAVGGKLQPEINPAVGVKGRVRLQKQTQSFGRVVVLDLDHLQLVLTEGYAMPMKPDFYLDLGLSVRQADIVITKNFFHFRIYYLGHSRRNLYVKTQGITDFDRLLDVVSPYPAWPKDQLTDWREIDAQKRQVALKAPQSKPKLESNPKRQQQLGLVVLAFALLAGHLFYHRGLLPRGWRRAGR